MANISNFITPPGSGGGGGSGGAITYGNQLQALTLVVGAGGPGGGGTAAPDQNGGGGGGGAAVEQISIFQPGIRYSLEVAPFVAGSPNNSRNAPGQASYLETYYGRITAFGGGSGGSALALSGGQIDGTSGASGGGGGQRGGGRGSGGTARNSGYNLPVSKGFFLSNVDALQGLPGFLPAIADHGGGGGSAFNPISSIISIANATTASVGGIVTGIDNNQYLAFGLGGTGNGAAFITDRPTAHPNHTEPLLDGFLNPRVDSPPNSGWGGSGGGFQGTNNGYDSGGGVVIVRSTVVPNVYSDATTRVTTLNTGNYFQFTEGEDTVTVFKADGFIEFPTT